MGEAEPAYSSPCEPATASRSRQVWRAVSEIVADVAGAGLPPPTRRSPRYQAGEEQRTTEGSALVAKDTRRDAEADDGGEETPMAAVSHRPPQI